MNTDQIKTLSETLSICPQLQPGDLADIAALGFRSVINARPDSEEGGQPSSDDIQHAATVAGLQYAHIPVTPNQIKESDVKAFAKQLRALPTPILGFCRSGMRCSMLWSQAQELD